MTTTKKNQTKPVRLTLDQAGRIIGLADDLIGRDWTDEQKAVMEPLVEQIQLIHAQMQAELMGETPAHDLPIRGRTK